MVLKDRKVWGGQPRTPLDMGCIKGVWGSSGASTVNFGKNFTKPKLQGNPDLVGAGHLFGPQIWIWKDLGPMSIWSLGHSLWRGVNKIKDPNSYFVKLDNPNPAPSVWGESKGGPVGFWSLSSAFWQKLLKQKLLGTPNLMQWVTFSDPKSGSERPWAWCASVAVVPHFHGEFIKSKLLCVFKIGTSFQ